MRIKDLVNETRTSLLANTSRTFLTILGHSYWYCLSDHHAFYRQGAQDSISASINNLGSNVLSVQPNSGGGRPGQVSGSSADALKSDDATAIESLDDAKGVSPLVFYRTQLVAGSKNSNNQVFGTTPNYEEVGSVKLQMGNFISESQNRSFSGSNRAWLDCEY